MVELADMADSDSVNSEEKQDADTSVDNICYVPSKQGNGKNASVEFADMVGKSSAESKVEQDMATSVDNICYEKIPCKQENEIVEKAVVADEGSVDSKEQDTGTSVDNVCHDKIQSKQYLLCQEPFT